MGGVGLIMAVYICAIMVVLLAIVFIGGYVNRKIIDEEDQKNAKNTNDN